jgi:hypothetical protein
MVAPCGGGCRCVLDHRSPRPWHTLNPPKVAPFYPAPNRVDASKSLVAAFTNRFPGVIVECNTVEDSQFFDRTFDAVVAWGLLFILSPDMQRLLIAKVARALNSAGHFLFTSPRRACRWEDGMTGLPSISLGHEAYEEELSANGLRLVGNDVDDGENYYYFARKG